MRRKGTLINAHIGRGSWWALLGVGPYSFAPWKVAWEALGRKRFTPTVLEGRWQGNQALHAFCPCASAQEAEALAAALSRMQVEAWEPVRCCFGRFRLSTGWSGRTMT